ncbi:hypothetical protein DFJ58DRAFT_844791 [Suillus subalutaceus]|uniref:uncharacterized protein n=1 Tax=Suillus subalutaceus TaxID=48586 RepID=UPI001B85BCF8|nr:uncharacterized protein DFJ58DRAFT_844791 [Suillus subalutaceus]KAG1842188.1 hypothetical protein DFJ58DRAFT_844791 [Suillus subalutaceus]
MAGRTPLVFIILASTCIFALCWGFMIVIWHQEYVILPDSVVDLIARYPTELTLISSVISTILSAASTILVTLLNSSWTTFILPTSLLWPVSIEGYSLDLSSSVFNTKLANDTARPGYYQNGFDILDIMASMSGTSATRSAVAGGNDSVFAFNGVSYITSSGGILPAVEDYAGTTLPPEYIGLEYYGGQVATGAVLDSLEGYTVTQQGLSANINCSILTDLDSTEFSTNFENSLRRSLGEYIKAWNWTASCPLGVGNGYWVTTDFWIYNNSYEWPSRVTSFVRRRTITLWGGLLRLKDSDISVNDALNGKQIVEFHRQTTSAGVVEFSATEMPVRVQRCRTCTRTKGAFTPLNGTMYITTYGWYRGRLTYIYILCVFTVIWAVTVSAAVYSLIHECIRPRANPAFDASNPVHLMMASGLETLPGFEDNGDLENERARVRLLDGQDVAPDDAVGEKTSARPTRSTMPRFEIVPFSAEHHKAYTKHSGPRLLQVTWQGGSSFGFRQARGIVAAKGPSSWPHSVTAMRTKLLDLSRARATEEWRKSIIDEDVMALAATTKMLKTPDRTIFKRFCNFCRPPGGVL